jgi:branched-chain amino acid aminotransferase
VKTNSEGRSKAAPSAPSTARTATATFWLDGHLVPEEATRVGLLTHTLHYGYGVFEGIRAYAQVDAGSAVFRLEEHIERLLESAMILGLEVPYDQQRLVRACIETLVANNLAEAYIRPIVFIGEGRMGIAALDNPIRVGIAVYPWGPYLGADALEKGIRTRVSSYTRMHSNALMVRAKVIGQYVNSILAKAEAKRDGYDEAIMLDRNGLCAEATGENLFRLRRGVLYTPPLSSPILAGVTRDSVLELAREMSIPIKEEAFTRDDLYVSEEAFLTGTAAEITPIREVDGRRIGEGRPGPVTRRIQAAYFAAVRGQDDAHSAWRTQYGTASGPNP